MKTTKTNTAIAVFHSHEGAEEAIRELQKNGFDLKKLSIVGKDYHTEEHAVGYYNTGDRMLAWGKNGAFWGGLWGMLFGSAFFLIPTVGPVLVAGPLVIWIVAALESAAVVGGVSVLGAALASIGVSRKFHRAIRVRIENGQISSDRAWNPRGSGKCQTSVLPYEVGHHDHSYCSLDTVSVTDQSTKSQWQCRTLPLR